MMIDRGRDTPFVLDFFCIGSKSDLHTGWSTAQVLEF